MTGPLDDIKVLEVANWVAGPSCAALMADMGADVIKVEPPGGDGMRAKLRQPSGEGVAAYDFPFQLDNRGKRSIAVDLAAPRGAELVAELAGHVDVVITNLLSDRLARYGLDPRRLLDAHPRLVYGLVTGYGRQGDDADRVAFDLTAFFARSGIMSLVGDPDGPPPPFRPGQGDHTAGLALLAAVLAALRERDRTGLGQLVETTLMHSGVWTIGCDMQVALVDHRQPRKHSRDDVFSPMSTQYRCADGRWLNLAAQHPDLWATLCTTVGCDELAHDARYATPADRYRHRSELIHRFDAVFAAEPLDHWAEALNGAGLVWAPVAELPDVVDDRQARATGMFVELEHPEAGPFETVAAPFHFDRSEVTARGPAPSVGQHTDDVLRDLGIDEARIDALRTSGVTGPANGGR